MVSTTRNHFGKIAKESVVQSPARFVLLNHVPVPFMELDDKARILRANEECAQLLNGAGTPLPGKSLFRLVSASDGKTLRESFTLARQTNRPFSVCVSILKRGKS